jgi:hypothetical protein
MAFSFILSLRSTPLESVSFGSRASAPGALGLPRKSGTRLFFLSLRSRPLECFFFGRHSSAPGALGVPRQSGTPRSTFAKYRFGLNL